MFLEKNKTMGVRNRKEEFDTDFDNIVIPRNVENVETNELLTSSKPKSNDTSMESFVWSMRS